MQRLDIWYVSDLTLCNFDCAYCVSGIPEKGGMRTRKAMWDQAQSPERFAKILRWIAALPYSMGVRLHTIGEPFVSKEFLAAAAKMTTEPRVRFIELATNGSLLSKRLDEMIETHGADPAKLSLWVTHHNTEISPEELVANAAHAQERGLHVVVNSLLFPDTVESTKRLRELCNEHGLKMNVDLGKNYNGVYGDMPFITMLSQGEDLEALGDAWTDNKTRVLTGLVATLAPKGLPCSAGHDYVFITPTGDVYPCLPYSGNAPQTRLGSALDLEFVPRLVGNRYSSCKLDSGCGCKEDFMHLKIAGPGPTRERSLAYWPAIPNSGRRESALKKRLLTLQTPKRKRRLPVLPRTG